tara:strand:- start:5 stop:454 length:450 start_codon:yes stop_codon:yes gene_type:complete
MAGGIDLLITTPLQVIVSEQNVRSLRAADDSGGFGILPGHAPFMTVLATSVVRWCMIKGGWSYCALRGGVLTIEDGKQVRIACREGVLGSDLDALETRVTEQRHAELEAAKSAKLAQTRLHAQAIRQIMRHLNDGSDQLSETAMEGLFE